MSRSFVFFLVDKLPSDFEHLRGLAPRWWYEDNDDCGLNDDDRAKAKRTARQARWRKRKKCKEATIESDRYHSAGKDKNVKYQKVAEMIKEADLVIGSSGKNIKKK